MKEYNWEIKARQPQHGSRRNATPASPSSSSSAEQRKSSDTEGSAFYSDDSYYDENDNMEMLCMIKNGEDHE